MRTLLSFLVVITLIPQFVLSQNQYLHDNFSMEWGERTRFRGEVTNIVGGHGLGFSAAVQRNTLLSFFFRNRQKLVVKNLNNLTAVDEHKVTLKGDGRHVRPYTVGDLSNDLIVLSQRSRIWTNRNELFYHTINASQPSSLSEGEKIYDYLQLGNTQNKGLLGLVSSENFSKLAAYFTIPVRANDYPGFGYLLLNEFGVKYAEDVTMLPYFSHQLDIYDHFIANNGDYYMIAKEYYRSSQALPWSISNRYFAKLRLFKVKNGLFSEVDINRQGYVIRELILNHDNEGNLICSGLFADDVQSGVRGVFFMQLDGTTNEVIFEDRSNFSAEFLNTGQASWDRNWRERIQAQSQRAQGFDNFKFHDFRKTADGCYIAVCEHQEMVLRPKGSPDEDGKQKYENVYFFDDVIVYKLSPEGKLMWTQRVPKIQESVNDEGYYSSIAHGLTNRHFFFLFNDNSLNYDENGDFNNREYPRRGNRSLFRNAVAMVQIDLNTGNLTRKLVIKRQDLRVDLVPQLSRYDYASNTLITYGKRGNQHRFGRFVFR